MGTGMRSNCGTCFVDVVKTGIPVQIPCLSGVAFNFIAMNLYIYIYTYIYICTYTYTYTLHYHTNYM